MSIEWSKTITDCQTHLVSAAAYLDGKCPVPTIGQKTLDRSALIVLIKELFRHGRESRIFKRSFWEEMIAAGAFLEPEINKHDFWEVARDIFDCEVEAEIKLITSEEGGRKNPIFSQYAPDWNIGNKHPDGSMELNGAKVYLLEGEMLKPGETAKVRLGVFATFLWSHIKVGDEIAAYEGPQHMVAKGKVLKVVFKNDPTKKFL